MHIILIILICIMLLLLAILIIPVKYKVNARINKEDEEDKWHAEYTGDVKLLFGFIKIKFMYNEEKPKFQVRLFGIPILKKATTKKATTKNKKAKKKEKKNRKHEFPRVEFMKKCWIFLKDILGIIKPRRFIIEGFYGFDDPSVTGAVCAISGIIKPLIPFCRINLGPVFDEESCDVKINIDGGFFIIEAVYKTLRFIFRKDIRKVLFKKHKNVETN